LSDEVLYEERDRVALITLNRPERLNAFNPATARAFWSCFERIAARERVRVVVLTGAGRAFCAGADLKSLGGVDGEGDDDWGSPRGMIDIPIRLRALGRPTICAVNGVAAGAGLGIALAADFRIAGESARFIAAQIRTARVPDAGLTYFLPRMLGIERALGIALTGRPVTAAEALSLGLVGEVVAGERLMARALSLAEELARGPALAMRLSRDAIYKGAESSLEQALEREHAALIEASAHPDVEEGTRAFLEKREPRFA